MDYDDLEQFALKILLRWDEEKQVYVRTEAAGELAEYFEEVMIDEYQDSNRVQETLLTSISSTGVSILCVQSVYGRRCETKYLPGPF